MIIRRVFALAVISLPVLVFSCGYGSHGGGDPFGGRAARLLGPENAEVLRHEQDYFADSLSLGVLYTSPRRNGYITAWVASFASPDSVTVCCERLFRRVAEEDPKLLRPLVSDICRALNDRGAESAARTAAALPYGIDATQYPEIVGRLLTAALLPGTKAPPITGLASAAKRHAFTILLFHKSSCRSCQKLVWDIREKYVRLQSRRIRVVTVSADTDERTWNEYAGTLPWPDKLCDYRGFYGPDMEAWGVAATPALFLIDGKGYVAGQYDRTDELWDLLFGAGSDNHGITESLNLGINENWRIN